MASKRKNERVPFGELAVRKGYCSTEEVEETLHIQRKLASRGRPKPLTGIIMVQNGFISTGELIDVLRAYQEAPPEDEGPE